MKTVIALFSFIFCLLSLNVSAATLSAGVPVVLNYSSSHVLTSAYTELVASTVKGVSAMTLVNLGPNPIEIAFGEAGSEVVQLVHPAPISSVDYAAPTVYPITIGYGTRISVIAVGTQNSTGSLQMNLLYN